MKLCSYPGKTRVYLITIVSCIDARQNVYSISQNEKKRVRHARYFHIRSECSALENTLIIFLFSSASE